MLPRFIWLALIPCAACAQARQDCAPSTFFTLVWPVERVRLQAQAQPANPRRTQSGVSATARQQAVQRALEEAAKERRAGLELARDRAAAQPAVAPERNEYLKYLADKEEEEEAKYDPIVAEVRAAYKKDEPDEFKKWKASQPPAKEKEPGATQPAQKELDLSKFLDDSGKPTAGAKPKSRPEEE